MPYRPAKVSQAEIEMAVRAMKSAGHAHVRVQILADGAVAVSTYDPTDEVKPPPHGPIVYLIGYDGWVKIGFTTKTVQRRLDGLQTSTPIKLSVIHTLPGSLQLESELHVRFAQYREVGEWFRREGELAAWIDAGCPL